MEDFLVSVIIPVYNGSAYLREAVTSALALAEVGEVVLIDDGSTDNSLDIGIELEKCNKRLRLLQHPDRRNHGVAASRNLGVLEAKFDYIAFLDADDRYLPNRFAAEKEIFRLQPEADGVYGCTQAVFEDEEARSKFLNRYKTDKTTLTRQVLPGELYKELLFGESSRFHTSGITLKRETINKTGIFNNGLRMSEDTELWLKLSLKAILVPGSINEPISIRRVHKNNSIHRLEEVQHYRSQMYKSLFDWSIRQPFSFEVINSFFVALHTAGKDDLQTSKRLFWKQAVRNPRMVLTPFFAKKIHQLYFK